jgi:hypothetical protein
MPGRLEEFFHELSKSGRERFVGSLITYTGVRELEKKLKTLEPRIAKRVIAKALRAGGKIALSVTKARTPVGDPSRRTRVFGSKTKVRSEIEKKPGYMKRSLKLRVPKKSALGTYAVMLRFDTARFPDLLTVSRAGKRYFYPAAVQYGHRASGRFAGGPNVRGNPFITDAFDSYEARARSRIIRMIAVGIEREARK